MGRPKKIKEEKIVSDLGGTQIEKPVIEKREMFVNPGKGSIVKAGFDPDLPENKQRHLR